MFILTAKLRPRRILLGAVAAVLVCGAVFLISGLTGIRGTEATSAATNPKGVKTNEARVA